MTTTSTNLWTPPAGTIGLDRSATIASQASSLYQMGYRFAIRTLGLSAQTECVLTESEAESILGAGMAIGLYQMFSSNKSYIQSASQGTTDGGFAVNQAASLGAPQGMTIWYDFEVTYSCSASTMEDYLNNWASAVTSAGYLAGMYIGGQNLVPTSVLSGLPDFHAYWQAACAVNDPGGIARGFQMYQLLPYYTSSPTTIMAASINIDGDVVQTDNYGGLPVFWKTSTTG